MHNNRSYTKYFNAFLAFILCCLLLMSLKYFFLLKNKNDFKKQNTENEKKIEGFIKHVHFVPDSYTFIKNNSLYNIDAYNLYFKKIIMIIETAIESNAQIVSLELFSKEAIEFMTYNEIYALINKNELWNFLLTYQNKTNHQINFYYSDNIPLSLLQKIESINKQTFFKDNGDNKVINIIIGLDFYYELNKKLEEMIEKKQTSPLYDIFQKEGIRGIIETIIPPIDISFVFHNADITATSLFHLFQSDIVRINYSIEEIEKNIISRLLYDSYLI